ncbi:MAG TPA: hypothetical protein VFL27_04470 [Candidatus Dormibacteraeota bacterium]|nr:hypothetical protein [Candidatus Dormibacteraeota bacterium]
MAEGIGQQVWMVFGRASHGLPRTSPALIPDSPSDKVAAGAVIGPFDDRDAARAFLKSDPRVFIYYVRAMRSSLTPEEMSRAITPVEWTAQGQAILGAVWIKPRQSKFGYAIGPFADEAVALQFANADRLLGGAAQLELRHGITPDDLMASTTPERWSEYLKAR